MAAPVYIGDEVTAAGFRLAGCDVRVPEPGDEARALAAARAGAPLVLVAARIASRLPPAALGASLAALAPLTVVVPDADGATALTDAAARVRQQLGLEA